MGVSLAEGHPACGRGRARQRGVGFRSPVPAGSHALSGSASPGAGRSRTAAPRTPVTTGGPVKMIAAAYSATFNVPSRRSPTSCGRSLFWRQAWSLVQSSPSARVPGGCPLNFMEPRGGAPRRRAAAERRAVRRALAGRRALPARAGAADEHVDADVATRPGEGRTRSRSRRPTRSPSRTATACAAQPC